MTVNNGFRKVAVSKKQYTRQQRTLMGVTAPRTEAQELSLWGRGLSPEAQARALRDEYRAAVALATNAAEIIALHKRLNHLLRRVWREAKANKAPQRDSGVKKVYK